MKTRFGRVGYIFPVPLPLEIQTMKEDVNYYMTDGLLAEITFLDRFGNFNRFKNILPMKKGRNLFLIKTIISLIEKLEIDKNHKEYLTEIRKWYVDY